MCVCVCFLFRIACQVLYRKHREKKNHTCLVRPEIEKKKKDENVCVSRAPRYVARAEAASEHLQLARAVASTARQRGLALAPTSGFAALTGRGIHCTLEASLRHDDEGVGGVARKDLVSEQPPHQQ